MKRFTETEKWKDKWFRLLCPAHKLAWFYILDNCDADGVIEVDEDLANMQIGLPIDWKEFQLQCGDRIQTTERGKWLIRKFVAYQGGTGQPSKALSVPKVAGRYSEQFEEFWIAYPAVRKVKKGDAFKAWEKAVRIVAPEILIQAAREYAASPVGSGDYSVMPSTFLNSRSWEDDRASWYHEKSSQKTFTQLREENTRSAGDRFVEKWGGGDPMLEGLF